MAGWKTKNNFSTIESVLWRKTGTSGHQLQDSMLKITKCGIHLSRLTVSSYKLSERPSYYALQYSISILLMCHVRDNKMLILQHVLDNKEEGNLLGGPIKNPPSSITSKLHQLTKF